MIRRRLVALVVLVSVATVGCQPSPLTPGGGSGARPASELIRGRFGDRSDEAVRVARCESNHDQRSLGAIGEVGLFQLNPIHFGLVTTASGDGRVTLILTGVDGRGRRITKWLRPRSDGYVSGWVSDRAGELGMTPAMLFVRAHVDAVENVELAGRLFADVGSRWSPTWACASAA